MCALHLLTRNSFRHYTPTPALNVTPSTHPLPADIALSTFPILRADLA
jgi:hypothetical protein